VLFIAIEEPIPKPINAFIVIAAELGIQIQQLHTLKTIDDHFQLGVGDGDGRRQTWLREPGIVSGR
jgi:hypothetical protein